MWRTLIPERRLARIKGRAHAASERRALFNDSPCARGGAVVFQSIESQVDLNVGLQGAPERRRCARIAMDSRLLVRRIGGFNLDVSLKDISTGGCRVELLEAGRPGDPAIVRFPQIQPLGVRICWAAGTTTGMTFLTSIHPAVFEMLVARLARRDF